MSSIGKANAALAAAVIFLLLSSGAAYIALNRLSTSEEWVRHTRDVQSALAQVAMTASRAGRLHTEYIESGDTSLIERQANEVSQLRSTISVIQRLISDNSPQQSSTRKLRELTERRIALMDASMALKRAGRSSPEIQEPISRQIVETADETDGLLQRMYDDEDRLLAERQARVRRFSTATIIVLVSSLVLALILFIVHHRLVMEQVVARTRAETAQRALSAKLLTLQDEERRRFARELHDSVGQHLAAMKMGISLLQSKLPGDEIVQDCLKLLDDSIAETRTISHLLHPPLLDEAGLNSACRWFVEGFAKRSGIQVNLEIQDDGNRLAEGIELVLFRVLQESLTNVHRHSGAARADVTLQAAGNRMILRIRDYGQGMPAGVLHSFQQEEAGAGVGLAGMTERMREIGGRLEIHSSAAGTEVVATAPVRVRKSIPPVFPREVQEQEVQG
jgi:signal transduction histidine kinase